MSETRDIIRLSHNQYTADITAFLAARSLKKKLDADSRRQDSIIKHLRSLLFAAMKGASIAKCGNALITIKPGKINPGALTLRDGRSIPLSDISEIVINKGADVIKATDVEKWFGGSVTSPDLEIVVTE